MVRLGDPINEPLAIAKQLAESGLQVFPARYKDKPPLVKWREHQGQSSHHMIEQWFKGRGNINYWVMTGVQSGFLVIDCDSDAGDLWWRDQIGDEILDSTTRSVSAKGTHYWFKIPEDVKSVPSWSVHDDEDPEAVSFDFRADNTGVIVPPSVHESGHVYRWEGPPLAQAALATPGMLDESIRKNAPVGSGDASGQTTGAGGQTRSLLSRLLSQPPGAEGSGRNDWLARVAGHYAKTYHGQEDLYRVHTEAANMSMGQPLDEAEFNKTIESVWRGEHTRNVHRDVDANCGFLVSGTTRMMCQVVEKQKDGDTTIASFEFTEYADFDLKAKGVMTDEAGARTYLAEIVRRSKSGSGGTDRIDVVIRAEILGDDRAFRKFLARYACTVVPPENMWPKTGSPGVRIQRYLESQQPPVVRIVPNLGFDQEAIDTAVGGYVTHEGVITDQGLVAFSEAAVRPDPRLLSGGTAPHAYGFNADENEARRVLQEVMTFHDPSVTSVFGAWWAACLLKPQIEERTSLFPFVGIEAPSESGKTNGFFQMLTQMNGNTRGETQPTKAALRDMAAAHRNGIVWVDDLDDPAYLMELLRAATSGGSLTKMGEDRESVKNTPIVAPIVISGEALGLGTQKALLDRAVLVKAPSPVGRRSRRDATRPQWDDILDLREQYPNGLHELAGWYVQAALGVVPEVLAALKRGRTGGSGRGADKVAVLRAGACLLDYLTGYEEPWAGTGEHAVQVEGWLSGNLVDEDGVALSSSENALTLELLPWALRTWKFQDKAYAGENTDLDTPVFVRKMDRGEDQRMLWHEETVEVWFHCGLVSEAWERHRRGSSEKRTTTEAALKDQAEALGCKSSRIKVANSGGRLSYYRKLTGPVAAAVINRATGQ